jgi:osmotically-inducible protein OsmY
MSRLLAYSIVYLMAMSVLQGCAGVLIAGAAGTTALVVHDRRTPGTLVDDQNIELTAIDRFYKDKELYEQAHIAVTSYNNVVLLTGEAPTQALKTRAEAIVRDLPKVRQVHNEIVVATPSSFAERSHDTALATKVKGTLLTNQFDPLRVKVVAHAGTVYLMGLVTQDEAETATEIVRQTGGVQRVVKLFEYSG